MYNGRNDYEQLTYYSNVRIFRKHLTFYNYFIKGRLQITGK